MIPLMDLKRQYASVQEEADKKVLEVLHNAQYIMGENVRMLEQEFAELCQCKYAVSVGNGTDALVLALQALGIGAGDEVITTPYTFFATAEAISFVGAKPVFVDVREDTYNINPDLIEEKITSRTKAILVVHIFGNPCEMDKISEIAKKHQLKVIEDAAQAVCCEYQGQAIGSLSDIACFSFFPTKNLGACGDAGMITTNDEDLYTICKALRVHGSGENGQRAFNIVHDLEEEIVEEDTQDNTVYNALKYYNYFIGHNSRTDELQAAILRVKLKKIKEWTEARRNHANYYNEALKGTSYVSPVETEKGKHVYHLYILQSENREEVVRYLQEQGVATGVYYPVPMHLQKVYTAKDGLDLGYKAGDYPVAEYLSHRTFAIPMFPELTKEELDLIVSSLKDAENV